MTVSVALEGLLFLPPPNGNKDGNVNVTTLRTCPFLRSMAWLLRMGSASCWMTPILSSRFCIGCGNTGLDRPPFGLLLYD